MTLKLVYFSARGRCETIRYLLHLNDEPFEDHHVTLEEWMKDKPLDSPFGTLPYIEKGEKRLGQSVAIARYFAVKHGLAGTDNIEKALVDQYVDGLSGLWPKWIPVVMALVFEKNKSKAEDLFKQFKAEFLIQFMDTYTKFLENNKTGYLVGNALTWADIEIAEKLDKFIKWDPTLFDKHPTLKKHHDVVYNIPKIKAFATTRTEHMV